jgi:hypothetical protein
MKCWGGKEASAKTKKLNYYKYTTKHIQVDQGKEAVRQQTILTEIPLWQLQNPLPQPYALGLPLWEIELEHSHPITAGATDSEVTLYFQHADSKQVTCRAQL